MAWERIQWQALVMEDDNFGFHNREFLFQLNNNQIPKKDPAVSVFPWKEVPKHKPSPLKSLVSEV